MTFRSGHTWLTINYRNSLLKNFIRIVCSLTLEKVMFYPLVENLAWCNVQAWSTSVPASDFERSNAQCVT